MYPAFHLFGIHIATYSLFVFLGIVAFAITYFLYVERGEKLDRPTSNRLIFVAVLGVAILAMSALVFNSIFHSIEAGEIIIGGITWLGGVIGMFPSVVALIHALVPKAKGNALQFFSLLIPGIVIGHAFGRVGCFFGGCCYGRVTDSVFGVVFPADSDAAIRYPGPDGRSLPVLPTQLFEAAFELALFLVLVIGRKKLKPYNLEIYLFAYGSFRFLLEFLRGDDRGVTGFFLTPSQLMSIILLIAGVLLVLFRKGLIFKKLQKKCEVWRKQVAAAPAAAVEKEHGSPDPLAAIKELHELKEAGAITDDEYKQKKRELLKRL